MRNKKRKMNRGNLYFEYTKKNGKIWWKGRFPKYRKPGGRSPERDLISLDKLPKTAKDFKAELTKLWFIKQQEIEKELEKYVLEKVTEEADRHTLSDAIKKATETKGSYIDLKSKKYKDSAIQQLGVWEKEIGHLKLSEITSQIIEETLEKLKTPERSNSTINRYTAILSSLLGKYCREFKPPWITHNPCSWKDIIRKPEPPERTRPLTKQQRKDFLFCCGPELRFAVILAIKTSARQGEIWKLKWDDVVFENQWLVFTDTKNGSPRTVPILNQQIWDTFKKLYKNKQEGIQYVFPASQGNKRKGTFKYINKPKSLRKAFETAREKAGLEDFHWHDLRHTGITDMMHSGMKDDYIKDVSGHKTDAMLKKYKHTFPVHLLEEMKKLEEYQNSNAI